MAPFSPTVCKFTTPTASFARRRPAPLNHWEIMAPNPISLTRTSSLGFRLLGFSRNTISNSRIPSNSIRISTVRSYSAWYSSCFPSNSSLMPVFKDLGRSEIGFGKMGSEYFRVSAVSGGRSGGRSGGTGGFGGFGDGNSGGKSEGSGGGGGGDWSPLSWYLALLEKYPVLTKAITSAILTLVGDLICQLVIDQVPSLDMKRTFLFTFLGLVLVGPTLHFWYLYLSKLVTTPGASGAFLRLLLDQFLFAPMFIGVFLSTLITLEGRPSHVVPKLQQGMVVCRSGSLLFLPIGSCGYLFSFSTSGLSRSSSRSLLLMLLLWHGMSFSHLKLTRRFSPNRYKEAIGKAALTRGRVLEENRLVALMLLYTCIKML